MMKSLDDYIDDVFMYVFGKFYHGYLKIAKMFKKQDNEEEY